MKVLIINTYEKKGGAARAAYRLFKSLKKKEIQVTLLVQEKSSKHPDVIETGSRIFKFINKFRPYIDFVLPLLQIRKRILFSTSFLPDNILKIVDQIQPDIVHLHWIAGGMIKIETLAKIKQPIIWTLHDLWAFTGGCHNPLTCTKYTIQCGQCPILNSHRENDLSRKVYQRKLTTYKSIDNLSFTAPSRWLSDQISKSSLLKGRLVEVIPNGLDTDIFKPGDKEKARAVLNLPLHKKLIVFGGIRSTEYELKGFHLLAEALSSIQNKDFELVVFGSQKSTKVNIQAYKVHFLGFIADETALTSIYQAADVVVVPSYQEVFGQTASEALSCGIPVVAFNVSGLMDIVDHKKNGYLAVPFDTQDLANGIEWVIEDEDRHTMLSRQARVKAETEFDSSVIANKFIHYYQNILKIKDE